MLTAFDEPAPVGPPEPQCRLSLDDFRAYMPAHSYIYLPTRALWPAASVNARIPPVDTGRRGADGKAVLVSAAAWLDRNQPVEQMTWAPGLPEIIEDRLLYDGGWLDKPGTHAFNLYLAPAVGSGDARAAVRWVDHVRYVYADAAEAEYLMDWLAHRVQRPHEKINHALVLGGAQGIGKDSILEPVKQAIGPWNFQEASPQQVLDKYNGFLRSVILRLSEARDLGESDRFAFYDHSKTMMASPPDMLRVNEKYVREYPIMNVCGVIITTNHKMDGIYLPADDRRHFVVWSDRTKEDDRFQGTYWEDLYRWYYAEGGNEAVAAFLRARDLSKFKPKAPPPKTAAFWSIVDAGRPAEESELMDVLDGMATGAFCLRALQDAAAHVAGLHEWLLDRKSRRVIPHRLEKCGYSPLRNPDAADGLWRHRGMRQVIYVRDGMTVPERLATAREMCLWGDASRPQIGGSEA